MIKNAPSKTVTAALRRSSEDGQAITAQGILRSLLTQLSTEAGQSSPLRQKLNDLDIDIADLQIALMPGPRLMRPAIFGPSTTNSAIWSMPARYITFCATPGPIRQ